MALDFHKTRIRYWGAGHYNNNAPMESFFKSYKTEEVQAVYDTHEQATRGASDYIEQFNNSHRLHLSLDYRSPIELEQANAHQLLVGEA